MPRRLAIAPLLVLALLTGVAGLAGCGSSKSSDTTAASTGDGGSADAGSDYAVVSDDVVATGLAESIRLATLAVQQLRTDQTAAKASVKELYSTWAGFEGTVRANDKSLYLDLEDGLGAIKNGVDQNDLAKAQRGLEEFTTDAATYLAAHPGTGSSTTITSTPVGAP